jgi:hypothetical protein
MRATTRLSRIPRSATLPPSVRIRQLLAVL